MQFKGCTLTKSTICTALSNTDFSEFGILLTTNTCMQNAMAILLHILDTVFIEAMIHTVLSVTGIIPSVQTSIHLFQLIWWFVIKLI